MLSRVAQNLYWLGRYVERAENLSRLLDVAYHLELDAAAIDQSLAAAPTESVLDILACRDAYEASRETVAGERLGVLRFLALETAGYHSILALLGRARENARASREALSGDAWDQLNTLYLKLRTRKAASSLEESPLRFLDRVKRGCILFSGTIESTLPRSDAFHFLQLGRHLERVNQTGRILQVKLPPLPTAPDTENDPLSMVHWSNLLRSCSAYEAYLREYRDHVDPVGVVGFLILSGEFPRAIRYCVERCFESVRMLSGAEGAAIGSEAERLLGRLDSELRFLDVDDLFRQDLKRYLVGMLASCNYIGEEIHLAFFFT